MKEEKERSSQPRLVAVVVCKARDLAWLWADLARAN